MAAPQAFSSDPRGAPYYSRDRGHHRDRSPPRRRSRSRSRSRSPRRRSPDRFRKVRSPSPQRFFGRGRSPPRRRPMGRKGRSRSRSRSSSVSDGPPVRRRTQPSGWDVPPSAEQQDPHLILAARSGANPFPQLHPAAAAAVVTTPAASMAAAASAPPQAGAAASDSKAPNTTPSQALALAATRQARRLYIGNLPASMKSEEQLRQFFNVAMERSNPQHAPGEAVLSAFLNSSKKFGFVEFRSLEEAQSATQLDGIECDGCALKVRRPSDFHPSMLPPGLEASAPRLNLSLLHVISTQVPDSPYKIFCGGLPYELGEREIMELVGVYGELRAFHLVKERDSEQSKGYCFFEFVDPSVTDTAVNGLNGLEISGKVLTVRRAQGQGRELIPGGPPGSAAAIAAAAAAAAAAAVKAGPLGLPAPPGALGPAAPPLGLPVVAAARADAMAAASISARPTRVLAFLDMVSEADLVKDDEYNEIVADIQEETSKYGKVQTVVVPRPSTSGPVRGVGKVFVEFQDVDSAINARNKIEGRSFGGRPVVCAFITEEAFAAKAF